ncbi:hypothetical protein [Streptomyces rimosus]|uniref:hypothetical protein n=1 Tax=Streptomyces rimosus TaxID=1927 RepID=UPI0004C7FF53|nr:hypothetical protein [Streptomyces rimosus]
MSEAHERPLDAAAFIDWLVEEAPKHGWDQAVINRRMEYPKELLQLGQKIIDRTPPSRRFDVPPFVWDILQLAGQPTHKLDTFQREAAQHFFAKYTPQ